MPANTALAHKTWSRYAFARDNGHSAFILNADRCNRFVKGDQWNSADKAKLDAVGRPALTINKLLPTLSNILGEQINNRAETSFRPRSGAPAEIAEVLSKVYRQISDNNQLNWIRSDVFANGVITGRGFFDARVERAKSMQSEVKLIRLNPKNVVIDPDAEEYDPDTWGEVFVTKWVTPDDIAVLYTKADADLLRGRTESAFPYGQDSIQAFRSRFGDNNNPIYTSDRDDSNVLRNIRLIERQHRVLDRQKHFVLPQTGDMRPIPLDFDRDRIAFYVEKCGFQVTTEVVRRIRWVVIADDIVLHDDWSPYKHFTVVPYFPHLIDSKTVGMIENLIGSQELLNKVTSQELHVVNTTANSGFKIRAGALANMTVEELEQKGAKTGLVIEINGDPDKDVQKIAPNQVPAGLDRISYKAEEHIKTISGVSDSMQGMDRADVAAKAIQAKRQAGSTNLVKPFDNLARTDSILARNILDLVQEFYTEEQLMTITHDHVTGETETFSVNQPNPMSREEHAATGEAGPYQEILCDLTLGEYDVVVSSIPVRETMEDSQFEQAMAMREQGIQIPDSVIVDSSRLMNKKDIIKQMAGDTESPEAQMMKQLQMRGQQAEVSKAEGEAAQKHADASLKQAKTQETTVKAQVLAHTPIEPPDAGANPELENAKAEHEAGLKEREFERDTQLKYMDHSLKEKKIDMDAQMKEADMAEKRETQRVEQVRAAAAAAQKPQLTGAPK